MRYFLPKKLWERCFVSFQFRRRNDVRDQPAQQEPFFQNAGNQPFTNQERPYPPMGYNGQVFEGDFPINGPMQQQFMQPGNFYGQQQSQQQMNHNFGFVQNQQQMQPQQPEAYLHPVQASQLNAQRANSYTGQEHGFQTNHYQSQNFANNPQNQTQGYFNNLSAFKDENFQQPHSRNPATPNPMAFWNETQGTTRFENHDDNETNSPIKLLVAVAGVALIGALSWFAYKWAKAPSADSIPLIHAEQGSHKVSPEHRGGINIPYQDKLIYNRIDDSGSNDPEERLLPPPEQPAVNQQGMPINNYQNPQQQMPNNGVPFSQGNVPQQYQNQNIAPPQAAQNQQATQQGPAIIPQQQISQQEQSSTNRQRKIEEDDVEEINNEPRSAKKAKLAETVVETSGSYYVQLATVKSEAAAIKEWNRLKHKHGLKGQKSMIKESERPDGETVFRLLMGPFPEKVKALKHAVKIDGSKVIHMTD